MKKLKIEYFNITGVSVWKKSHVVRILDITNPGYKPDMLVFKLYVL